MENESGTRANSSTRIPRVNGYRRHLDDIHCPLANNMAAQYFGAFAIGDQFAKTDLAPVDNRARSRLELYNRCHDVVCFAGLRSTIES